MTNPSVSSRSAEQLHSNGEALHSGSLTDWERLDAMRDEDIDFSDCPEWTQEMFDSAVFYNGDVARFKVECDSDTAKWFQRAPEGLGEAVRAALLEYRQHHS